MIRENTPEEKFLESIFWYLFHHGGLNFPEDREALRQEIKEALKALTPIERDIIELRSGLGDGFTYTLEEIGKIFDIPKKRVLQLEARAIRKLQNPVRARRLREFLGLSLPQPDNGKTTSPS